MNLFSRVKINHEPRSINTLDNLSDSFRATYIMVRDKWKYTARISELISMLKYCYSIEDFELVEIHNINHGEFESWMMDKLIEYKQGHEIDFGEVWEKIKSTYPLTKSELTHIETGAVDERLWAIFTILTNPNLDIQYN